MSVLIQNLTQKYGKQLALDKVSLSIQKGEIVGLLGPNGAGKSTLMKSITGAIIPNSGEIKIDEYSVLNHPIKTKKKIGFLPENNPLYYDMYVKEYLNFVADIREEKKDKVTEIIQKVGLTPESHKKIGQLSKGYKQRVGLAQAILSNPEILILDEPTNGLDPNQILEIREIIREIGQSKTVILSTHIMQEVEALCSRVILLNKGKIISDSPIEEFKGQYKNLEDAFHQLTLEKSSL
ncbi:MAG: ATP-binding cassette domain-containing protein [Weeksellaceae bacterium]|nr:ATP-binding cassette domain-containing protein [Weeksellaceae bacterium]